MNAARSDDQLLSLQMHSWCADDCRTQLIYPETKELTFNIAFRVLVGLDFKSRDEQVELFKTFDTMITNLFSLPYDLPGSGYRKVRQIVSAFCKLLVSVDI